jgi:hypothetical protein
LEEIKSSDFVCKLIGLNDIYKILVTASLSVQKVNKYPWEYDDSIEYLKEHLTKYGTLLQKLDTKLTEEVEYSQGNWSCLITIAIYF